MIDYYGQSIINLFTQSIKSNKICGKIGLCATEDYSTVSLDGSRIKRSYEENRIKHCTWGPAYVCSTNETALECKVSKHNLSLLHMIFRIYTSLNELLVLRLLNIASKTCGKLILLHLSKLLSARQNLMFNFVIIK